MTKWERAAVDRLCGRCAKPIPKGRAIHVLIIGKIVKIRCSECDGPEPPDLPPLIERMDPQPRVFSKLGQLLPLDWKTRGAGDRTPGEEG